MIDYSTLSDNGLIFQLLSMAVDEEGEAYGSRNSITEEHHLNNSNLLKEAAHRISALLAPKEDPLPVPLVADPSLIFERPYFGG